MSSHEDRIPRFGDLVKTNLPLDGDKLSIFDVIDKPIVVIGFKMKRSKFNDKGNSHYMIVQFYFEDDPDRTHYVFFTGSNVIIEQLKEIDVQLNHQPGENVFRTIIKKVGNYMSLS